MADPRGLFEFVGLDWEKLTIPVRDRAFIWVLTAVASVMSRVSDIA